jgi:ketosteroid isomerase-like protein
MDDYSATKELARANRAFYEAFEALDLDAMAALWDDTATVRCVHPGASMIQGRERVLASWHAIFQATDAIRFELVDLEMELHGELACVHLVERITTRAEGTEQVGEAVATNLFARRGERWRLLLHHASPLARRLE